MRVDLLLRNANLATMTDASGYAEVLTGALAVRKGKIAWLGPSSRISPDLQPDQELDCGGQWLTPGLIDCHTHLVWAGNRADEFEKRLHGVTYQEIARSGGGILSTVTATRAAASAELLALAQARLDSLLAEGVTTVEIKSGYGLDIETELKCLRVAKGLGEANPVLVVPTYLGAHAMPPEFQGRADDYIESVCEEALPAVKRLGGVAAVDAFCETIAFSPAQCRRVLEAAKSLGFRVKLHADQLSDSGGGALIAELGGLSADHVEYTSEASVEAMAGAGTVAVLLPGAYYTLRETRKPAVNLFRANQVPMAVATDCNPGTSPCTSLLLMLNMACVLFGLTPSEALAGATRNAARALGLQDETGQLAVGMRADLALYAIDHPRDLSAFMGRNPLSRRWFGGRELA